MLKYEIASASVKVSLARTSLVGRQNATCYGAQAQRRHGCGSPPSVITGRCSTARAPDSPHAGNTLMTTQVLPALLGLHGVRRLHEDDTGPPHVRAVKSFLLPSPRRDRMSQSHYQKQYDTNEGKLFSRRFRLEPRRHATA